MEAAESKVIRRLEALIIGSEDFRELEERTDRFCPFEATGMARQELRHSHFLSYMLDPNRPHTFGNSLLKEFLYLVAEGTMAPSTFSKLTYHFMDFSNLRVLTEWKHIDILIEIENKSGKGVVIAIENKIDSGEHGNQLSDYKKVMDDEYPDENWHREFVFLTIDGTLPSKKNAEDWQPISLEDLILRFEKEANSNSFGGPSLDTFNSYILMLRRHILKNSELESLARKIWAQHREALETLNAYAPDLNGEMLTLLGNKHGDLAKAFSEKTGIEIVPEESSRTILRFAIKEWDQFSPLSTGDGSWTTSKRVFLMELAQYGGTKFRVSFVIGPGDGETREEIYQAVLAESKLTVGRRTETANAKWKHLSSAIVLKEKTVIDAENKGMLAEDLLPALRDKTIGFLKRDLPLYSEILKNLFCEHEEAARAERYRLEEAESDHVSETAEERNSKSE